jgi:DNA-directed RNA polymerase subunit E'/Rpb7
MSIRANKNKIVGIYAKNILSRKVSVEFNLVGSNLKEVLNHILVDNYENQCDKEGYIKENSINVITYSSGILENNYCVFDVVFECLVCKPVEGMTIRCKVENITKAGIKCTYYKSNVKSPFIVFVIREHNYNNPLFAEIMENDEIIIRVVGIRYELHDENISIIADLVSKVNIQQTKEKIKIYTENEQESKP